MTTGRSSGSMESAATALRSPARHQPSPDTTGLRRCARSAPPTPHGRRRVRTVRSALRWGQTRERGVDCRAREPIARRRHTYRSPRNVARALHAHSSAPRLPEDARYDDRLLPSAYAGLLALDTLRQAVLDCAE